MIRALVRHLYKVVHDAKKFKLICKIISEYGKEELVKSVTLVYCILKFETHIIQHVSYEVMYPILKEQSFFKHYEEIVLQRKNTVEGIVDILKDKEMHYFHLFLSCLEQHSPSISLKIKDEQNSFINIPSTESCTSDSLRTELIGIYTGTSFKNHSAGLDNEHTFVFPTLIEFDHEDSVNDYRSDIFNEQESHMTISTCSEIFNKGHRVVLLQGPPGSGKTTIAYKICREWTEGKLEKFSHVIVMHLEDDRVTKCKDVEEFMEFLVGKARGIEIATEIRKNHGQGILFILEGWDHLLPKQQHNYSLFSDLVKGRVVPKATVAITGRPSACVGLPYQFINYKIQIFGFTKGQVDEYINCSCKNHPNRAQLVQKICSQFQCSVICIPVNLCIIVTMLKQPGLESSSNVTELYKMFMLFLLTRHKKSLDGYNSRIKHFSSLPYEIFETLWNLAELAYYNLVKNKVTFDEEEIGKYCFKSKVVPQSFDGMGLLQVVNSICLYVERTFQFTHQNLQELLAAWYLSQQTKSFQQQHQLSDDKEMFHIFFNDFVSVNFEKDATPSKLSSKSSSCTIC